MTDAPLPARPRYDEGCLAAHALNLIGDRWALLVVRELMFAPKRFQMLRGGVPEISASVLNGRLAQMKAQGIVTHDPGDGRYGLTSAGRGLLPVLEALCDWALTQPGHDPNRFISPSALMISMGVTLRRAEGLSMDLRAGFDFGREAFEMQIRGTQVITAAKARPVSAFLLRGSGNSLAMAIYGPQPLDALIEADRLQFSGDLCAAQRFVNLFALTPQAQPQRGVVGAEPKRTMAAWSADPE